MSNDLTNFKPEEIEHIFTIAEIAAMNTETFAKYEKAIFAQMAKGLIK